MEKKRVFLYLQAALCILTVIILGASVIGIYREGALWKAAGHPGDWIFTPEKAREVILRVLPVILCGCVLTVTGLLQGVMDGKEELPPADTETSRDLICGRVKEPAEAMIHERELQKKLRIGGWAGALGCMVPVLLYITDGRNFESTDLEAVMGALVMHILPWTAAALVILAVCALLGENSMKREMAAAGIRLKEEKAAEAVGTAAGEPAVDGAACGVSGAETAAGPAAETPGGSGTEAAGGAETDGRKTALLRGVVLAAAVVCILAGIYNGSMRDVLFKAINICTECIGLG